MFMGFLQTSVKGDENFLVIAPLTDEKKVVKVSV